MARSAYRGAALGLLVVIGTLSGDGGRARTALERLTIPRGDADRGRALIQAYGCGICHKIPGIGGRHGKVGPPLAAFAGRAYIGGVLPNRPGNLVKWLMDPPYFSPNTAMPDMGIGEGEANDIAAYLRTLQ